MPVDKFGRMSDTKTRDTGVSLTYINNNYIRSDGSTPVTGSIDMKGNTLTNVSNPENPKDVATKEYSDYIKSILNKNIVRLTQLYIILSQTQEENKEKFNKTQEEINKTQEEINKTQEEIYEKINEKSNLIMVNASYKGRLNSGDYQFSFLGNIINKDKNIGFLMPYPGRIKSLILETPFDFSKITKFDRNNDYEPFIEPLLEVAIQEKVPKEKEIRVRTFTCEIHYERTPGREVDLLNAKLKRIIVYDFKYEDDFKYETTPIIKRSDVLNIKTKITGPKIHKFLKDDDMYHFTFLIELYPL